MTIKLVPEDPEDQKVASMVTRYRTVKSKRPFVLSLKHSLAFEERQEEKRADIEARPILSSSLPSTSNDRNSHKEKLQKTIEIQRHKRLNGCFIDKASPSEKRLNLGIVKKNVVKDFDVGEGCKIDDDSLGTSAAGSYEDCDDKKDVRKISLVADYTDSSDSE